MQPASPYVRDTGSGPGVVCLHCNASASGQWKALAESLSGGYRVLAPDLYGSGRSPPCPTDRLITLRDEVALIEPVLRAPGAPVFLIGHSHGGAVAMMAALLHPELVRALILYEPSMFALVDAHTPPPNGVDGIRNTVTASLAALGAGDNETAARLFLDFWNPGSWEATPVDRRPMFARAAANLRHWDHSLFGETTPLAALARLRMPILCMMGGQSPESGHAVSRLLLPVWPHAQVVEFPELGHMGPVTHPDVVNAEIAKFLAKHR